MARDEEIPEVLIITPAVRQGHGEGLEKQQREEYLNGSHKRAKLSCISGLIGGDSVDSINQFKETCEGLIGDDVDSQVAVLFYAEYTIMDEVFGRDTGDGIEERRFKKLMYRLGAGLLGFKDKDISKDLDKKEEYQAKKDALVFIVELMRALSTVVKDDRLKELPYHGLLEAIRADNIEEAMAIMEASFLQLEFFSYIDEEMKRIKRTEIGELKDKYEGLEAKQKDVAGWEETKLVIDAWEVNKEERILDLMEGQDCRGFLFPASASPASQNLRR